MLDEPFEVRRRTLLGAVDSAGGRDRTFQVSRVTTDPEMAREWFSAFEGAGLDGVVGKRLAGPYVQNKREMIKIKHKRAADCVIIGYRIHKSGNGIGLMPLGLHTDGGDLHMVGGSSAFSDAKRIELQQLLEPMRLDPDTPRWVSRPAGGRVRTVRGFRCGRSWLPNSPTTRWRIIDSGTP